MENKALAREYKKIRAKGGFPAPATQSIAIARFNLENTGKIDWNEKDTGGRDGCCARTQFKMGVFDVWASVHYDELPWDGDDGEFKTTWEPGAIPFDESGEKSKEYFLPPEDCGIEQHTKCYQRRGASKQAARYFALEDARRMMAWADRVRTNDVSLYGVKVSVFLNGDSVAEDSIWGVQVEYGVEDPYITDAVKDLMTSALAEAEGQIEKKLKVYREVVESGTGVEREEVQLLHIVGDRRYTRIVLPWDGLDTLRKKEAANIGEVLGLRPGDSLSLGKVVCRLRDHKCPQEIPGEMFLRVEEDDAVLSCRKEDGDLADVNWLSRWHSRDEIKKNARVILRNALDLQVQGVGRMQKVVVGVLVNGELEDAEVERWQKK